METPVTKEKKSLSGKTLSSKTISKELIDVL
jgi:hypothetical protein